VWSGRTVISKRKGKFKGEKEKGPRKPRQVRTKHLGRKSKKFFLKADGGGGGGSPTEKKKGRKKKTSGWWFWLAK